MNVMFKLIIIQLLFIYSLTSKISDKFKNSSYILIDYLVKQKGKNTGYKWLETLVDDFGSRHLGSKALENAIDYNLNQLKLNGFDNVHDEIVDNLPYWKRGKDKVHLLEPRKLKLKGLALGGTRAKNVTAFVVVLKNFDDLEKTNVTGKIVLFNQKWSGYSQTVKYRRSAYIVEKRGAVGLLVKSISSFSLSTPHTGSAGIDAKIPAFSITIEEAEFLERLYKRGKKLLVHMAIQSDIVNNVSSRNTIFDIKGALYPQEIVLLSGHIDSWDVGQGALDDGGGIAAVWQAMNAILQLKKTNKDFVPKRTIRCIFWTAEEQGLLGAKAYYNAHKNNINENFIFVSETDQGAFRPNSYNSFLKFMGSEKQKKRISDIVKILNAYGIPLTVKPSREQGDVIFWAEDNVCAINYVAEKGIDYYFYFHHTKADYLNVFQEGDIDYTAAIFGVLAHVLANMDSWD